MRVSILGLAGLVLVSGAWAQELPPAYTSATLRAALEQGLLRHELPHSQRRRSVPLAMGLSAIVPGAGQAYNGDWIKASAGVALEVGVLWLWSTWRSKGIIGRDDYQAAAHSYWSPVRYALWLNDYTAYLNSLGGSPINTDPIVINDELHSLNLTQPEAWTSEQQLAVRHLILSIRDVELLVYHPETGARFSHQLPFFGEQQYYELIGKYFQFAPGWYDYEFLTKDGLPTWMNEDGTFVASIDPESTAADGSKPFVSSQFYAYAEQHADANDYLRRARRVTILFFANHLLAAADAAISAKLRNNRLQTRLTLVQRQWAMTLQLQF